MHQLKTDRVSLLSGVSDAAHQSASCALPVMLCAAHTLCSNQPVTQHHAADVHLRAAAVQPIVQPGSMSTACLPACLPACPDRLTLMPPLLIFDRAGAMSGYSAPLLPQAWITLFIASTPVSLWASCWRHVGGSVAGSVVQGGMRPLLGPAAPLG